MEIRILSELRHIALRAAYAGAWAAKLISCWESRRKRLPSARPPCKRGAASRARPGRFSGRAPLRRDGARPCPRKLARMMGGDVTVTSELFADTPSSIEHIRTAKLRALAVTTAVRSDVLPEIPTVSEFVPGFEATNWFGVAAPKNTPAEIIDKLNKEINIALAEPKIKARLADLGAAALAGSPTDFGKLISEEAEKWGKVIRAANIKPDS